MDAMDGFETLEVEVRGPVARIALNRPEMRNAMSHLMVEELLRCFTALRDDPAHSDVRAVVLRANGPSFCSGGDVRDLGNALSAEENRAAIARLADLLHLVNEAPQVVIARVQGHALGGGLGLVCVSDFAVAGFSAIFGLPETHLGLVPAVISPFVVQRVGLTVARRLMLTGIRFGPESARAYGLVQETCADLELDACVEGVIAEVLQCAPRALRACKALLFRIAASAETPYALRDETVELLNRLRAGEEAQQGMQAFLGKTPPPWAPRP